MINSLGTKCISWLWQPLLMWHMFEESPNGKTRKKTWTKIRERERERGREGDRRQEREEKRVDVTVIFTTQT